MASEITAGRSYVIRNRKGGYVLNVAGNGTNPSAKIDTWDLQTNHDRNSQLWHLFPLDQGSFLIVNKNSGQVLNVVGNSSAASTRLEQYPLQSAPEAMQTWMLRPAPGGGYFVVNKRSGLYMNIQGNDPANGRVEQYHYQNGADAAQVWDLEVEDEYKSVLDLAHIVTDPADVGDVLRLTGFRQPTKKQTDAVLIGQAAVPFPLVQDPALSRDRQAQESPYYLLKRHGYWSLVYYFEHSGSSEYTKSQEVKVGLTTTNSREVESTVGISVTAEASFSYGGFSGSLSATLSAELKVTTSSSSTQESTRTDTVSRTYAAGKRASEAIWYKEDRYTLERLDGTKVTEWTVRDSDTVISDGYSG
ncbi:RICIN domain-containing protein [Streptomyces sp. NPDC051567]|uniref:RICIN domain-containing protein n=1 Tax=Streptomyces sp. NPDC051567 TaxID=3365660 RepID=UPI0037AAB564